MSQEKITKNKTSFEYNQNVHRIFARRDKVQECKPLIYRSHWINTFFSLIDETSRTQCSKIQDVASDVTR